VAGTKDDIDFVKYCMKMDAKATRQKWCSRKTRWCIAEKKPNTYSAT